MSASGEEVHPPPGFVLGYYEGWADAKAGRGYGEGAQGSRPIDTSHQPICAIVSLSGPKGEPLACGLPVGHSGRHAWATLPTFTGQFGGEAQ